MKIKGKLNRFYFISFDIVLESIGNIKKLLFVLIIFLMSFILAISDEKTYLNTSAEIAFSFYHNIMSPLKSPISECQFTPSCSNYSSISIKNKGFLVGIIMTSDRLIRCGSGRASEKDYNVVNDKFIDFPSNIESDVDCYHKFDKLVMESTPISLPDSNLSIAYYLYQEQEYDFSMLELKKLLIKTGEGYYKNKLLLLIGTNYLLKGNKINALNYLAKINPGIDTEIDKNSFLLNYVISDGNNTHLMSINLCDEYLSAARADFSDTAKVLKIYSLIRNEQYSQADSIVRLIYGNKFLSDFKYNSTVALISEHRNSGSKSPFLSGIFSTVIPGTGYLYCGRFKEAASAFIINGLLGWGIYSLFDNKNYGSGILLSMISVPFYLGNIVGSVNAAEFINNREKELINMELRNSLHISFYFSAEFLQSLWKL